MTNGVFTISTTENQLLSSLQVGVTTFFVTPAKGLTNVGKNQVDLKGEPNVPHLTSICKVTETESKVPIYSFQARTNSFQTRMN